MSYPLPLCLGTRADKKYRNDGVSNRGRGRAESYPNGTVRVWGLSEGKEKVLAKSRAGEDELNQIPYSVIFLPSNDLRKIQYDRTDCASVL